MNSSHCQHSEGEDRAKNDLFRFGPVNNDLRRCLYNKEILPMNEFSSFRSGTGE